MLSTVSFHESEKCFLKGVNSRLSIVLFQPVEDTLLALTSLTAVEKSVVRLTAISLWVVHLLFVRCWRHFVFWCFVAMIRYRKLIFSILLFVLFSFGFSGFVPFEHSGKFPTIILTKFFIRILVHHSGMIVRPHSILHAF